MKTLSQKSFISSVDITNYITDSGNKLSDARAINLLGVTESSNNFSANGWSYEDAKKYLFNIGGKLVEAGFYSHFADDKADRLIKQVIELPTSFSCPMKCAYCASSLINDISPLDVDVMITITQFILDANDIDNDRAVLIALTGTGDAYYTLGMICEYLSRASQVYKNFSYTISSCNWTHDMLMTVEKLQRQYRIRNVQSTFISNDENVVASIIPGFRYMKLQPLAFIDIVKGSMFVNWRINYLMMDSINDGDDHFIEFIKMVKPINDKVIIRISSLNETFASRSNGLKPSNLQRSEVFKRMLNHEGINAYIFHSVENNNMSCGQLVLEKNSLTASTKCSAL